MLHSMSCYFIIVFFIFSSVELSAQRKREENFWLGYIVKASGDTINGSVFIKDHYFNVRTCLFKELGSSEAKNISEQEIVAYGVRGKKNYLSTVSINRSQLDVKFVECILQGTASLFYFDNKFFLGRDGVLQELGIGKKEAIREGKTYTIDVEVYKSTLLEGLKDCSDMFRFVSTAKLNKKDLQRLFIRYYACTNQQYYKYEVAEDNFEVSIAFSVAFVNSLLKIKSGGHPQFRYIDNKTPIGNFAPAPSIVLEFSNPGFSERIGFRSGLSIFTNNHSSYDEDPSTGLIHDLRIKSTRLQLPILLRFDLLSSKTNLYILAGVGLNAFLKWEDKLTLKLRSSGNVLDESSPLNQSSTFLSLLTGIGFQFPLKNKKLFIESNFDRGQLLKAVSNNPNGVMNTFSIGGGFKF